MYKYLWSDLPLVWVLNGANGSSSSQVICAVCLILWSSWVIDGCMDPN